MAEYMACCDCVITKAGPGTIAEALTCGVPILVNGSFLVSCVQFAVNDRLIWLGCIPCQEEGNIPFVLDNGVGAYSEDPANIADIISQWFGSQKDTLKIMSNRAARLGRADATFNIVRSLAGRLTLCSSSRQT